MRYFKESVETMPRKPLEALQIEKLRSMLKIVYGRNRFYTGKLENAGIHPEAIKTLEDLSRLPLTTKEELLQAQSDALQQFPLRGVAGYSNLQLFEYPAVTTITLLR